MDPKLNNLKRYAVKICVLSTKFPQIIAYVSFQGFTHKLTHISLSLLNYKRGIISHIQIYVRHLEQCLADSRCHITYYHHHHHFYFFFCVNGNMLYTLLNFAFFKWGHLQNYLTFPVLIAFSTNILLLQTILLFGLKNKSGRTFFCKISVWRSAFISLG